MIWNERDHPRNELGEFTYKGMENIAAKKYAHSMGTRFPITENRFDASLRSVRTLYDDVQNYRHTPNGELYDDVQRVYDSDAGPHNMTPDEKIASVHIVEGQDNILPELNDSDLKKIGKTKNKPVLVKKTSIDYNLFSHDELDPNDFDRIIGEVLYSPEDIVHGKNPTRESYSFIKVVRMSRKDGRPVYGVVLLDVSENLDCFEVIHWHWVHSSKIKSIYPKQ